MDGHWIVTLLVPLGTSAARKYLSVRFDRDHSLTFSLPLRPHPRAYD